MPAFKHTRPVKMIFPPPGSDKSKFGVLGKEIPVCFVFVFSVVFIFSSSSLFSSLLFFFQPFINQNIVDKLSEFP